MNRIHAHTLLSNELAAYRGLSFEDLSAMLGTMPPVRKIGEDGQQYDVEITIRWQQNPGSAIMVEGSVSPADWGAPHDILRDSFVVSCLSDN
jgi:hypothetical protein